MAKEEEKNHGIIIIFADGVFDFYHRGHREHFRRLKTELFPNNKVSLLIGVVSDEECTSYKRKPVMCQHQRLALVSKDMHVDKAMITGLNILTEEFIIKNKIDYVAHAFSDEQDKEKQKQYFKVPIEMKKFIAVPYVQGISSSAISSEWKKHTWSSSQAATEATNNRSITWDEIKRSLKMSSPGSRRTHVLEVGFGAGILANEIARDRSMEYIGVDPSMSLVVKHLNTAHARAHAVCQGHGHSLPFKNKSFDHVIMRGMSGDHATKKKTVSEICRVAKQSVFIGNVSRDDPLREICKRLRHTFSASSNSLTIIPTSVKHKN